MNHLRLDLSSIVLFFSNLRVIVSEFYDLDVGTVKKIEIKPKRIMNYHFGVGTWTLKEVQRCNLWLFFIIQLNIKTLLIIAVIYTS